MEEKIFKAAACCYPHLGDYSKKVLDECIEEGSKKYDEVLNGIELPRNCSTLANCIEAVMGNFFHDTHDEKDSPFRKALLYCKNRDKGVRLTGNHKLVVNDCFSMYLNMKPAQLSKTLTSVSRAKANNHSHRTAMDYDREIEFIKMLYRIKTSRTIHPSPPVISGKASIGSASLTKPSKLPSISMRLCTSATISGTLTDSTGGISSGNSVRGS